eukprot:TRINITY_DN1177_c0_g2_i4.p1 TRINITY_DN1177_c0_g2~~TRINITY_DN1177_c0_g2_i4.p1  ORF type:complete len:656 (-),score=133.28 TRINITY_DN1177_c0_g2_i4:137-2104(-)
MNGEKGSSLSSNKFSLGGNNNMNNNNGGGMSGQWSSGLLSQQLSGSFGPGGLSGLLGGQSSGTFGPGGLSGLLSSSKQNTANKLQPDISMHGNFRLNQLGGSSQSFGSLSSLLSSQSSNFSSSNSFTSAGSMDFGAKRMTLATPSFNSQNSTNGIIGNSHNNNNNNNGGNNSKTKETIPSVVKEETNNNGTEQKKKRNLKIKTRIIPEEPMEEREIEAEFEQMRMIMRERGMEFKPDPDASLPENSPKNRYFDVLPNIATSVKIADGSKGSTYINANYVSDQNLEGNPQKYICCQAPLMNTFADFWAMIWEKNCPVIVMLTRLEERNLIKADVYWPDEGTSRLYGGIMVTHKKTKIIKKNSSKSSKKSFFGGLFQKKEKTETPVDAFSSSIFKMPITSFNSNASFGGFNLFEPGASLSSFGSMANLHAPFAKATSSSTTSNSKENENTNTIVVRKFSLYDVRDPARTTRELVQLHYTEWPDFGVPDSTEQMSDLIRELDIRKKGLDDPIVVHCSAGIGRTGTFLAIHMALQQVALGLKPTVDVFETVINLRAQRNGMVQSKDQYKFVYVTIKDMLMDKYNKYNGKSKRNELLNKTQTNMDQVRAFIEKAPRNRPTRSASEPIIENLWKKLIDEDEFPQRMDEVRKKLANLPNANG